MKRSRISKKMTRRSQQTLLLSILAMLVILFLFFKFGIPLLATIGGIFEKGETSTTSSANNDPNAFVPAPLIDAMEPATKSARIEITGTSVKDATVILFVNGNNEDSTNTEADGSYNFEYTLSEGDNIIKAKAKLRKAESEFSDSQVVSYRNSPPALSIDSPSDNATIKEDHVTVTGKTDAGVKVTVNDFWAVMNPDNSFSYVLKLTQGDNQIKVAAIDNAENKTEKSIKVTYSP